MCEKHTPTKVIVKKLEVALQLTSLGGFGNRAAQAQAFAENYKAVSEVVTENDYRPVD